MEKERADQPKPLQNLENQGLPESQSRYRLQLDFSQREHKRLLKLREKFDAQTNAEVVRNALVVYEWYLDGKERGAVIRITEGDVIKDIELLLL